jgi:hypothetical protein
MVQVRYSNYARIWGIAWLVLMLVSASLVLSGPVPIRDVWGVQYDTIAIDLLLLMLTVPLMHAFDQRNNGYGLSHVYHEAPITSYQLNDTVVSGLLAPLSLRALLTVVVLGFLLSVRSVLHVNISAQAIDWRALLTSPIGCIFCIAAATLAASAAATLVSLLCYDYSVRFDWHSKGKVRYALQRKAHRLSVVGFYWLMWSCSAMAALVDLYLCLAAMTGTIAILWYYFFFPTNIFKDADAVARNATSPTLPAEP